MKLMANIYNNCIILIYITLRHDNYSDIEDRENQRVKTHSREMDLFLR